MLLTDDGAGQAGGEHVEENRKLEYLSHGATAHAVCDLRVVFQAVVPGSLGQHVETPPAADTSQEDQQNAQDYPVFFADIRQGKDSYKYNQGAARVPDPIAEAVSEKMLPRRLPSPILVNALLKNPLRSSKLAAGCYLRRATCSWGLV